MFLTVRNALFITTLLLLISGCSTPSQQQSSVTQSRDSLQLKDNWLFLQTDSLPESIHQPQFSAEKWQTVSVPHSWNRVGYYQNEFPHLHTEANVNMTMGVGIYRTEFSVADETAGKQFWLEFDAVSRTAEVWLNGQYLGEHRGGFNRFRFDATPYVSPDKSNVLVVKVDNSKPTAESSTADTLPISGDFFVHGGIYRPVRLITTADVHLDMQDYGGPGVYATTTLGDNQATVTVTSRVSNSTENEQTVTINAQLIDGDSGTVAQSEQQLSISGSETGERIQQLTVTNPELWQGMENPHLYTLRVQVIDTNGTVLDQLDQQYGLREITVTADKGVLLNGKPLRLQGVAYHQDREGRGWAVSEEDIAEDINMLVEMGANTIRLAHYPHGQPVHEIANETGLILWDEIPLVTVWRYGEQHEDVNQALLENASLQLEEMIKQNFNHPSVAVWGIANEVDFGAVIPAFLGSPSDSEPDPTPVLTMLHEQTKALDPERYSTLANCCEANKRWANAKVPATTDIADTVGLNRYYGWYYGKPTDLDEHLDTIKSMYPQQPISVSEYGAGGALSMHTDNVLGGPVASTGKHQPEEYMSYVHEENWQIMAAKPYLWATWIWNAFDFATTTRREGDSIDINTKGLISYDREIKKDSYYFYQANWREEPVVHITSRRYIDRAYQQTPVKVYSNLGATELVVNGKSAGVLQDCPQSVCVFEDVALQQGSNTIVAKDANGGDASDSVTWQLAESQVNAYYIDAGAIMAAKTTQHQYGSDAFFSGGSAKTLDKASGWGRPPVKAQISQTDDRDLAATYRAGEFSYTLPLANGRYRVSLMFVAPVDIEDTVFTVSSNGKPLMEKSFTATKEDAFSADISTAEADVTDGQLQLSFVPQQGEAFVSAVVVTPLP